MHRILDILCLVALGVNAMLIFPSAWLGLAPTQSLSEFLKGWEAYAVLSMVFSAPLVVVTYLAGADVKNQLLKWIREKVLARCFATSGRSFGTLFVLLFVLAGQALFLHRFYHAAEPGFTALLFEGDPAGAQSYAALQVPVSQVDGFLWEVAEAGLQAEQRNSRSENPETARTLAKRFDERREIFRPATFRYLLAYGRMKIAMALGNPQEAIVQAAQMEQLGRFLGEEFVRRGKLAQGLVYLSDREGVLFGRHPEESRAAAIKVFQTDSSAAAQRNLGSCYYLNNQIDEAISVWDRALINPSLKDTAERKRLLNNLAMGFVVLKQSSSARKKVQEGLTIPFETSKESERREQIRLLATKAAVSLELKDFPEARKAWNEREKLKVDEGSPCTYALQAQLLANECVSERLPERKLWLRAQLWFALVGAVGLKPGELELDDSEARLKLAAAAASKFKNCYRGLEFDTATVAKALNP
jgi:tetratricopeptide (TPR) repeat protein